MNAENGLVFWGLIASPFQLKMQALADAAAVPWQRWPDQATTLQALGMLASISRGKRRDTLKRYASRHGSLDEVPAVPIYRLNGGELHFDSTGLAHHLDSLNESEKALIPSEPDLHFLCQLIDEAFDEFGLYMVHHNRWVTSAQTNRMGVMTAAEFSCLMPAPIRSRLAGKLARRQSQRCPYLFSVAAQGFDAGVQNSLTPPDRDGFPPTHALLDRAWRDYLAAMETLLTYQPFLLGDRFTLADASAYGQLSMNLVDGKAQQLLAQLAPLTHAWLCMIRDGGHTEAAGELYASEHLSALLKVICKTFVPLMQQNNAAYEQAVASGQSLFNEPAFDKGEALYAGQLLDQPFRAVVKSFQVAVWQELVETWAALSEVNRTKITAAYPCLSDAAFSFEN